MESVLREWQLDPDQDRTLWGKSPCEVAESVIRRLQNTSSWTGSEAELPRWSASHAPNDVVGKVPCEVSESVIRRLQNTSSWTGNEAEF